MGSVAAAMKSRGYEVTGSDQKVYPPMSTFLEGQGIELMEGYAAENIQEDTDVIIIGNAISRGNPEAEEALSRRLLYMSLPEVLKSHFLRGKRNFVVTGTHGKTTTSSILTWLMKEAGVNPSHMIGGVPKDFGKGADFTDSEFVVLEGDEYDTAFFDKRSKFLHYLPECVIVNNIEFDHADIYDSVHDIKLTFSRLLTVVPNNGLVILNGDDKHCLDVVKELPAHVTDNINVVKLGFNGTCDTHIEEVTYEPKGSSFTLEGERYFIPMVGEFNVRNAAASVKACLFAGLDIEAIKRGLASFGGIARRQDLRGEVDGVKVIDDFAHHPTAIKEAIKGLRQLYPEDRLWVIFEPRSNTTRRNVFQTEMAEALALADHAIIPAIEDLEKFAEDDRLDTDKLKEDVKKYGGHCDYLPTVEEIVQKIAKETKSGDVVAVLSNGGFEGIHERMLTALRERD